MAKWLRAHAWKYEVPGQVIMILDRKDTDELDEKLEGLIARAEVVKVSESHKSA
jgi:hypothetical protein